MTWPDSSMVRIIATNQMIDSGWRKQRWDRTDKKNHSGSPGDAGGRTSDLLPADGSLFNLTVSVRLLRIER